MFINPRFAIDQGWITFPDTLSLDHDAYIQPNAIDWTMDDVRVLSDLSTPYVFEHSKKLPHFAPVELQEDNKFLIAPQTLYDVQSNFSVNLPEGVCSMLFVRSTFSRCGIQMSSGLYDSGYEGRIGATIMMRSSAPMHTSLGVRIGQIAFVEAATAKMYAGGWNHASDTHWTDIGRTD